MHYVSAREHIWLILFKIWWLHCNDYEECRLLEYQNTVRTSQETHYVSATQPSWLMLCKIWGFRCGDYEEFRLWYATPCTSCENRRFGRTCRLHHHGDNNRLATNNVSSNWQPKHPAVRSSETSVLTRAKRRKVPEGGIVHTCSLFTARV
jgi:hypothetical protein